MQPIPGMNFFFAVLLCVSGAFICGDSTQAEVLPEGKVSEGYYWQRVERRDGKMIIYFCRSVGQTKIQKVQACQQAGAQKP